MSFDYVMQVDKLFGRDELWEANVFHLPIDLFLASFTLGPLLVYLSLRFLGHTYPVFGCPPDPGDVVIPQHSDAMLLHVSSLLYCDDIIDSIYTQVCLFILSLHVFTGCQCHESVSLKIGYTGSEEMSFACEFCIGTSEFTLRKNYCLC
jgi:hypothetical protein